MTKRWIMLTAESVQVVVGGPTPNIRNVCVRFDLAEYQLALGLSSEVHLGIELTPDEARHLAQLLLSMAASAEGSAAQ